MKEDFMVLVVEDDAMTRRVIVDILEDDGFKTEEATGYQETLKLFVPGKYQVIVLDHQLGDGDGTELCRQLIEIDNQVKIFLFAGATDNVRIEALEAGASEVLQKPYDLTKLPFLIKRVFRFFTESSAYSGSSSLG